MKYWLIACIVACLLIVGCGGSGGSDGGGGVGNANVRVFVTDDPIASYQSIWVTIKKIELTGPSGNVTAYESATGNVIDLTTLSNNGNSQFELLGIASIPAGTYSSVKVTLDQNVSLIPENGGATQTGTFAGSQDGVAIVTFELDDRLSNQDNLIIDFDLQNWQVDNGIVTPVLKKGAEDGLSDDSRHEHSEFEGTIANLSGTGASLSFDLRSGNGTIKVTTDDATSIYRANGQPSPTLQNGTRVHVRGKFNVTAEAVVATSVKIQSGNGNDDEDEVHGLVGTVDAGQHTFALSITEAAHFVPNTDSITVATSGTTLFFDHGGVSMTQDEFYTWLTTNGGAATARVEVEGTYDETTKVLTATKVKLETGDDNGGDDHHESEVTGAVSNLDKTAHTFSLTVQEFEGAILKVGDAVTITVDANTVYFGNSHTTLTMEQFFAQVANGAKVEVKGSLTGTTVLAQRIKLED